MKRYLTVISFASISKHCFSLRWSNICTNIKTQNFPNNQYCFRWNKDALYSYKDEKQEVIFSLSRNTIFWDYTYINQTWSGQMQLEQSIEKHKLVQRLIVNKFILHKYSLFITPARPGTIFFVTFHSHDTGSLDMSLLCSLPIIFCYSSASVVSC